MWPLSQVFQQIRWELAKYLADSHLTYACDLCAFFSFEVDEWSQKCFYQLYLKEIINPLINDLRNVLLHLRLLSLYQEFLLSENYSPFNDFPFTRKSWPIGLTGIVCWTLGPEVLVQDQAGSVCYVLGKNTKPFNFKIKFLILLTVNHTILMKMLLVVQRI